MMEFLAERVAERNARDFLAGDRIHHDQIVGKHRERADRLDQAEPLEHPEHVGAELDAGADLLELGRLLDDLRRDTLARQRQSRGQPADAAADDEDGFVLPIGHACFLRRHCRSGPVGDKCRERMRRYARIFGWWPLTSTAASCGSDQEKARQQSAISVAPENATMKSE